MEAAMIVLKDKVFCRTRAFNVKQLFHYLTVNLSDYYSKKILDIITERHQNKNKYTPQQKKLVNLELISGNENIFTVHNTETKSNYQVNLELGFCSCPVGSNGALCKHQHYAAIKTEKSCHNISPRTIDEKMTYHLIATGKKVDPSWYAPLISENNEKTESINLDTCEPSSSKEQVPKEQNQICQEMQISVNNKHVCSEEEEPQL